MEEAIRLNKYLSDAGICSRREADRLIEAGKVLVDGQTASMGMKVAPGRTSLYSWQSTSPGGSCVPPLTRTRLKISWNF